MRLMFLLALVAVPATAHAETFTFTDVSKPIDSVYMPGPTPDSRPSGAEVFSVTSKTTFADGKAVSSVGKCSSWILSPGSGFGVSGVCQFTEAGTSTYSVAYTCEWPAKDATTQDCWGKLVGTGGTWKGRLGTVAWVSSRDGTARGTGQWD